MNAHDTDSCDPLRMLPVTVPGDIVLFRDAGLVIWAGTVSAWAEGFEFSLLMLADVGRSDAAVLPELALDVEERGQNAWLSLQYADGRSRASDLNANTPYDQPAGPHLDFLSGQSIISEGRHCSRWFVAPLPPPGPIQLTIHLGGHSGRSGVGYLDGRVIAHSGSLSPRVDRGPALLN